MVNFISEIYSKEKYHLKSSKAEINRWAFVSVVVSRILV